MQAIRSALRQDYPSVEVIVIDNASSDDTAEMVRQKFPNVRLISSEKNLGCPSGRNLGFSYCGGKYIYLLDDDGELDDRALSLAVKRAESHKAIAVVSSAIYEGAHNILRVRPGGNSPTYQSSFVGCCSLLRGEALRQVGPFPEDFFRQGEEEDLAIRMLNAGWFCFSEPASIMYHSRSPVGRDQAIFDYYCVRNTTKTGLRLWPFPYNIARLAVNAVQGFRIFIIRGDIKTYVRLCSDLIEDLRSLKGQRRPVSIRTMRLFRRLQRHPSPVPLNSERKSIVSTT